MTPVIAVTLLVGVTVALGGAAYLLASGLMDRPEAPPAIVMVEDKTSRGDPCSSSFWTAQSSSVRWNDLQITVRGVDSYGIRTAGETVLNGPWRGDRLSDELDVTPDDRVRVWIGGSGERATLSVTHLPTGMVVFSRSITAPSPGDPPSASLDLVEGERLRNITAVTGRAGSDCPDLAHVDVALRRRSDGAYYSSEGMRDARSALEATGLDWSVPVDGSVLTPGDYRVRAVPYDLAGTAGAPAVVNVTYQPDCDPGFAFEDADNDGWYDPDVDTQIPDSAILDGSYTVDGSAGLVVPPSVGDISNPTGGIHYDAGSGHLVVDSALVAGAGPIRLETEGRVSVSAPLTAELGNDVEIVGGDVSVDPNPACGSDEVSLTEGTVATDGGEIVVQADGRVRTADAVFTSIAGRVVVRAGGEALLDGTELVSAEADVVVDAGRDGVGRVDLVNGTLTADLGDVRVTARGDVDARDAWLQAPAGAITIDASDVDRVIRVEGTLVDDLDDVAEALPEGVRVEGTPTAGDVG